MFNTMQGQQMLVSEDGACVDARIGPPFITIHKWSVYDGNEKQ